MCEAEVLWVVLSALFFKEIWNNGSGGHGHMFASAKGEQQKYVRQLQSLGTVYWTYPILPFGMVACSFFPTTFLEIAVYTQITWQLVKNCWIGKVTNLKWDLSAITPYDFLEQSRFQLSLPNVTVIPMRTAGFIALCCKDEKFLRMRRPRWLQPRSMLFFLYAQDQCSFRFLKEYQTLSQTFYCFFWSKWKKLLQWNVKEPQTSKFQTKVRLTRQQIYRLLIFDTDTLNECRVCLICLSWNFRRFFNRIFNWYISP